MSVLAEGDFGRLIASGPTAGVLPDETVMRALHPAGTQAGAVPGPSRRPISIMMLNGQ